MKCSECGHKNVCEHKKSIENLISHGIDLLVKKCAHITGDDMSEDVLNNILFGSADNIQEYNQQEIVVRDYNKLSDMLKEKGYRDAAGKMVSCPTCNTMVVSVFKCINCGKPVCAACGVAIKTTDNEEIGLQCEECWGNAPDIEISPDDTRFIRDMIKKDIPKE